MTARPHSPAPVTPRFVRAVFVRYGADLHHFLLNRLRRNQDASDAAQEVYLRLLRLKHTEFVRQPHSYVYHVACQVIAQFRMREQQDHEVVTYDSDLAAARAEHPQDIEPDPLLEPTHADFELQRLLSGLSPTHRDVFLLRRCDGLSWSQIAERLQLSVHTVKKYICEANARISVRALQHEGRDDHGQT